MSEDYQEELAVLRHLIREASTLDDLNDLHRTVVPTEVEQAFAEARLDKLSAIAVDCQWEVFQSQFSLETHKARAKWLSLRSKQDEYEAKYF